MALGERLMPVLGRKAGRVLATDVPTGVDVADAIVHGGLYPAATHFGATSVGTLSIRCFKRPVCYQNMPEALLPEDLRGGAKAPTGIPIGGPNHRLPGSGSADPQPAASFSKSRATASAPGSLCPASFDAAI